MSDIRVRRSRLLRTTPRRHPEAGTSFGSQAAHDRQTVREPDVRMSRRYGTAAPRGSSINQTARRSSDGDPQQPAKPTPGARWRSRPRGTPCPRTTGRMTDGVLGSPRVGRDRTSCCAVCIVAVVPAERRRVSAELVEHGVDVGETPKAPMLDARPVDLAVDTTAKVARARASSANSRCVASISQAP